MTGTPIAASLDLGGAAQPVLGLAGLRCPLREASRRNLDELAFLDRAVDEGYRVMDTAAIYGLGASERMLGRWMRLRRNRDAVFLISKGGHPRVWRPSTHRLTVEAIGADLASSLRRLGTERLDLYLLHRDAAGCDLPAILQFLDEQVRRGAIGAIGVSNWHHERIDAANAIAHHGGLTPFTVSSPQLSLLSWTRPPWRGSLSISGAEGASARAWYREHRLPVLAWSPFGGGLRTAGDGWTPSGRCYDHPANHARLRRAAALARERQVSVPAILLAYLASLPFPVHPIWATRNPAHLRDNRAALDLRLSADEIRSLDAA